MMTDPGSSFPFSITENGLLSVETGAIDEAFGPREFQITLTDNREPVQTSNTACNITINDVNDKNPNFTFPAFDQKYWIDVNSATGPLTTMTGVPVRLAARDEDGDPCYSGLQFSW